MGQRKSQAEKFLMNNEADSLFWIAVKRTKAVVDTDHAPKIFAFKKFGKCDDVVISCDNCCIKKPKKSFQIHICIRAPIPKSFPYIFFYKNVH